MSQEAALRDVFRLLARLKIHYMLTGSYASNIYGRVRSTFDADVVLTIAAAQLVRLAASLGKDFYLDADTLDEVREAGGQFNAIHRPSGLKIDFYLAQEPRDHAALNRSRTYRLWNTNVSVISPEDLILSKLAWAKKGASARQIEDARGIYEVQRSALDLDYLASRAADLDLREELRSILK